MSKNVCKSLEESKKWENTSMHAAEYVVWLLIRNMYTRIIIFKHQHDRSF